MAVKSGGSRSSLGSPRKPRARPRGGIQPTAQPRAWARLVPFLLAAACAAVYANSLNGPLLFDDQRTIEENASIRDLTALGTVLRPPEQTPVHGRPLANLTFAINFAIGGLDVRGYHFVNLAIHILTALALLGVLRRTWARRPPGGDDQTANAFALIATLAWAIHPLNSEVIDYVTQRTEALMALFYLLALYCAIRALDAQRSRRWEIAAGAAALCGVASKEVALTVPIVIVLWDRVFAFSSFREAWAERRRLYAMVTSSWLLFAVVGRTIESTAGGAAMSPATYLMNQGPVIVEYLKRAVWPVGLVFDYGVAQELMLRDVWPSVIAVGALVLLACVALRSFSAAGFWAAWFFITLAPTSSVIPIPLEAGAERRMYLPLIALVVLAATAAGALVGSRLHAPETRRVGGAITLVVLGGLAWATVVRNAEYRTGLSIWQTVIDRRPHWRAHEHLSTYLREAGRIDDAIAHLRIAAAESANSRHALAAALLERGDAAEAVGQFREFIRRRPNDGSIVLARRGLASALAASGHRADAIAELRTITASRPDDVRSWLDLAEALAMSGDPEGAVSAYRAAIKLQPDNVVALSRFGALLVSRRQVDEALPMLLHVLDLDPGAPGVRLLVTQVLLVREQFSEAERQVRTLLREQPGNAEAHNLLGVALASMGRRAEATKEFAEALRLDARLEQARANLERITGKPGR